MTEEHRQIIEQTKAANPGVAVHYLTVAADDEGAENPETLIVFRKLNRIEYQELRCAIEEGGMRRIMKEEQTAKAVTLYPPKDSLALLLEEYQALTLRIADAAYAASSGGKVIERKKA